MHEQHVPAMSKEMTQRQDSSKEKYILLPV